MANEEFTQSDSMNEYKEDKLDQLNRRASQLSAMLTIIYGGDSEGFHSWSEQIKDNYLWACADHAREIESLALAIATQPK